MLSFSPSERSSTAIQISLAAVRQANHAVERVICFGTTVKAKFSLGPFLRLAILVPLRSGNTIQYSASFFCFGGAGRLRIQLEEFVISGTKSLLSEFLNCQQAVFNIKRDFQSRDYSFPRQIMDCWFSCLRSTRPSAMSQHSSTARCAWSSVRCL